MIKSGVIPRFFEILKFYKEAPFDLLNEILWILTNSVVGDDETLNLLVKD